jgi:hypothetical protein
MDRKIYNVFAVAVARHSELVSESAVKVVLKITANGRRQTLKQVQGDG